MSGPLPAAASSLSSSGFEDGLGRRVLAFDRETGEMLERLLVRPELGAFEKALEQRIGLLSQFEDERFARPRAIEDDEEGRLTVLSEFVAGRRLSDALDAAQDGGIVPGLDAALGLLLELLPALANIHGVAGFAHGAISPARVILSPGGQIVLVDSIYGVALERLAFNRQRLWNEFGIAVPPSAGPVRFDMAADLTQAGMTAAALIVGRPLGAADYPNGIQALRAEILEVAQIRGTAKFASGIEKFFDRVLPIAGRKAFPSADDAVLDLRQLVRKEIGIEACRSALLEFFQQVETAEAEREAERLEQARAEAERRERDRGEAERRAREEADARQRARIEAERRERERLEAERHERERLEAARREKERLEAERREKERLEAERRERERLEAERREKERLEAERRERERLEAERLEKERLAKLEAERKERERLEAERREKERLEAERREKERLERERIERERLEAEQRERERLEAERLEAERLERERIERERLEAELRERARLEAERIERERRERERIERERLEAEQRERARLEAERLERERQERERLERERLEAERKERERLEAERRERERLEAERLERERQAKLEAERKEKERIAAERRERERLEAERVERERQAKLEAERKEKERIAAERRERERLEAERRDRERREAERLEREKQAKLEAERKEKQRLEAERRERERTEAERRERERAEAERREKERAAAEKREQERREQERREHERLEQERLEQEELAAAEERESSSQSSKRRKRDKSARSKKDRLRSTAPAPGGSAPAQPPAAPAAAGSKSSWLVPPDRAAAFEPPVAPAPDIVTRGYPVYMPPAQHQPAAVAAPIPAPVVVPPPVVPPPVVTPPIPIGFAPPKPIAQPQPQPQPQSAPIGLAQPAPIRLKHETPSAPPTFTPRRDRDVAFIPEVSANPTDTGRGGIPWKTAAAVGVVLVMGIAGARFWPTSKAGDNPATTGRTTGPPPPPVDNRKIPANVGQIVISTDPAGARVLLDGKPVGESPVTLPSVSPGRHTVTLITDTGNVKKTVRVEGGKSVSLDVPIFSGFAVISAPIVVEVSEGGRLLGTSENQIMLSPGKHQLKFTNNALNYQASQAVEIEPGETFKMSLDPRGTANINAQPWAEVWIDGVKAGETPIANVSIALGVREIVFRNPQFGERKVVTTITGGAPAALSVDFTKPQ